MELLNNIWNVLITPNEGLIKILSVPFTMIEVYLSTLLFTSLLNISTQKSQRLIYVLLISCIGVLATFIIPSPFNLVINYLLMFILIPIFFKTTLLKTFLSVVISSLSFALIGMFIMNPYLDFFNISYNDSLTIPIYRIIYVFIQYFIVLLIYLFFNKNKLSIFIFNDIDKKQKHIIYANLCFGIFTILTQALVTVYYIDNLPLIITFLSFITMFVYFSLSIYSLTRVMKLASTTQKLQNAEEYNKTLSILHDSVRGFKHDFDNIVTTIGGYVKTNDMEGLKKYYVQLEDDCQKVNSLYILNPKLINNTGVDSLLTTKYHEAEEKGIKVNMSLLLDLSKLNMKIYEFTRILGILLDNAIEASDESEEKVINIVFRDDAKNHRQLIIVENTYKDKTVDTEKIFNKGFSGKENHTGLGLWEVRKILNKSKNLDLYTTKNEKYFSQQVEIYY